MFWVEPPSPHDSFLKRRCESVSLNSSWLCHFFSEGIFVVLEFSITCDTPHTATLWVGASVATAAAGSWAIQQLCAGEMLLGRVSAWDEVTTAEAKMVVKNNTEAFKKVRFRCFNFLGGEKDGSSSGFSASGETFSFMVTIICLPIPPNHSILIHISPLPPKDKLLRGTAKQFLKRLLFCSFYGWVKIGNLYSLWDWMFVER